VLLQFANDWSWFHWQAVSRSEIEAASSMRANLRYHLLIVSTRTEKSMIETIERTGDDDGKKLGTMIENIGAM
jgi:hypothetical protein